MRRPKRKGGITAKVDHPQKEKWGLKDCYCLFKVEIMDKVAGLK
jgi:hypothetical protein